MIKKQSLICVITILYFSAFASTTKVEINLKAKHLNKVLISQQIDTVIAALKVIDDAILLADEAISQSEHDNTLGSLKLSEDSANKEVAIAKNTAVNKIFTAKASKISALYGL